MASPWIVPYPSSFSVRGPRTAVQAQRSRFLKVDFIGAKMTPIKVESLTHEKKQEVSNKVGDVEGLVVRGPVPLPAALVVPRPILIFPFVNQSSLDDDSYPGIL